LWSFKWKFIHFLWTGSVLGFNVERQTGFDLPLNYVSQCTTGKNEAILEFHPNEEASVALMEMRFYIPQEGAEGDPLEVRPVSRGIFPRSIEDPSLPLFNFILFFDLENNFLPNL
jgi:hypothetical protein